MRWAELIEREPLLTELLTQTRARKDDRRGQFCANAVLFDEVLSLLSHLVGPGRGMAVDPRYLLLDEDDLRLLRSTAHLLEDAAAIEARDRTLPPDAVLDTHAAYEVAYEVLAAALPPCRNCACARREPFFGGSVQHVGSGGQISTR